MAKNNKKKFKLSKDLVKYMPALAFCLIIAVIPIMYLAIPDSDFSSLEKRKLSQMPKPTFKTVFNGKFGKDFETYLNDQMPMRTFFVGTNAYYDLLSGRNGQSGIYKADDDYLMVTPVEEGTVLQNNIKYVSEFIEDVETPSYICIVPSSGYIYADKLPANHYEYHDGDIIGMITNNFTNFKNAQFVDITEPFELLSKTEQLYYRTDHHWTSKGAYECYKTLGSYMGFKPSDESDFDIESYSGFYGTNYSKSALWGTKEEAIELWNNKYIPEGTVEVAIDDNGEITTSNDMFFRENLKTNDQYTTFLDGNHAKVTITNHHAESHKKLLVLRDSYSHCLAPFLAANYEEITLIDLRYYLEPVSQIVKSETIDQILIIYSIDSIVNSTDIAGMY